VAVMCGGNKWFGEPARTGPWTKTRCGEGWRDEGEEREERAKKLAEEGRGVLAAIPIRWRPVTFRRRGLLKESRPVSRDSQFTTGFYIARSADANDGTTDDRRIYVYYAGRNAFRELSRCGHFYRARKRRSPSAKRGGSINRRPVNQTVCDDDRIEISRIEMEISGN